MNLEIQDFDAVIFDMDGVLIDSEPLWKIAMEEVFSKLGSTLTKSDFQKTVGLRIDEVIHFWNLHENWGVTDESEVEEQIIAAMEKLISENPLPLPGVIDTLEYLQSINMPIGLATSSSSRLIRVVVESLNIKSYFTFTHSAELEHFGKPHPAVYLSVAKKLIVYPEKCLVLEDSVNGIIAGKAAKMKVVCIPEKTHLVDPRIILADFQFDTMSAFLETIR